MPDLAKSWDISSGPQTLKQASGGANMKNTKDTFKIITENKQDSLISHLAIVHIGDVDGQMRDARWPDIGQIHMICNL